MSTETPQSLTQNTFWCEMGLKPHPEPAAYIMADYGHASEASAHTERCSTKKKLVVTKFEWCVLGFPCDTFKFLVPTNL